MTQNSPGKIDKADSADELAQEEAASELRSQRLADIGQACACAAVEILESGGAAQAAAVARAAFEANLAPDEANALSMLVLAKAASAAAQTSSRATRQGSPEFMAAFAQWGAPFAAKAALFWAQQSAQNDPWSDGGPLAKAAAQLMSRAFSKLWPWEDALFAQAARDPQALARWAGKKSLQGLAGETLWSWGRMGGALWAESIAADEAEAWRVATLSINSRRSNEGAFFAGAKERIEALRGESGADPVKWARATALAWETAEASWALAGYEKDEESKASRSLRESRDAFRDAARQRAGGQPSALALATQNAEALAAFAAGARQTGHGQSDQALSQPPAPERDQADVAQWLWTAFGRMTPEAAFEMAAEMAGGEHGAQWEKIAKSVASIAACAFSRPLDEAAGGDGGDLASKFMALGGPRVEFSPAAAFGFALDAVVIHEFSSVLRETSAKSNGSRPAGNKGWESPEAEARSFERFKVLWETLLERLDSPLPPAPPTRRDDVDWSEATEHERVARGVAQFASIQRGERIEEALWMAVQSFAKRGWDPMARDADGATFGGQVRAQIDQATAGRGGSVPQERFMARLEALEIARATQQGAVSNADGEPQAQGQSAPAGDRKRWRL